MHLRRSRQVPRRATREAFAKRKSQEGAPSRDGGKIPFSKKPFVYETKIGKPGFVRLQAFVVDKNGKRYTKSFNFKGDETTPEGKRARNRFERQNKSVFFDGGAGAEIEKLTSHPEPKDFDAFWAKQYARLDRVPIKADMVEIPCQNKKARL